MYVRVHRNNFNQIDLRACRLRIYRIKEIPDVAFGSWSHAALDSRSSKERERKREERSAAGSAIL